VTDLVAGQIKFGFGGIGGVAQHVRAGRLNGLAISTRNRSPLAPDLPTIAESGYPEFEFDSYHVLAAPAGLPEGVAGLLDREVQRALASSELQEKLRVRDIVIAPTPSAEATARIKSDVGKWAGVVRATGMQVD
jgi:tripartite-type tricarboxylate transporter receptor subunit TctC